MQLSQKLEVLIKRSGVRKSDFARNIGITYRALANYISGMRLPKKEVLGRISRALGVTPEFLSDDRQSLQLTGEERFEFESNSDIEAVIKGVQLLSLSREVFGGKGMTSEDKQTLFSYLTEIYFSAKAK
jgi:transcriptional regulator with XRE-family HTH domain